MSSTDHPAAGTLFLVVVACGIGFGSKNAIENSRHVQVRQDIRAAVDLGSHENFAGAVELLRDVLRREPENTDALFNLGVAQFALDQTKDASETFGHVLELNPKDYEAMMYRARLLKQSGKVEDALAVLEQVPPGEGHVPEMLSQDAIWEDLDGNVRMNEIRKKHGLQPMPGRPKLDTSLEQDKEKAP